MAHDGQSVGIELHDSEYCLAPGDGVKPLSDFKITDLTPINSARPAIGLTGSLRPSCSFNRSRRPPTQAPRCNRCVEHFNWGPM